MKRYFVLVGPALFVSIGIGSAFARPPAGGNPSGVAPMVSAPAPQEAAAENKGPHWKSNDEYNAFDAMTKETDPHKKVFDGEAFIAKFPNSDFKDLVYLQEVAAYQQLADAVNMYKSARNAVQASPDNVDAIYWACVSFPYAFKASDPDSAQELTQADTDAHHALEVLPKTAKPANLTEEQFSQKVKAYRATFNNTVGFVALQKKDYPGAIIAFKAAAEDTPNDFTTFYRLGLSYWYSKPPDYANAAWYMSRSASLARAAKNAFEATVMKDLKQLYVGYHGSDGGLEDIITQASTSPNPPDGFKIEPAPKHAATGIAFVDAFYSYEDALKSGGDTEKQQWAALKGQPLGGPGFVDSVEPGADPDTTLVHIDITDDSKSKDGTYDFTLRDKQPDAKGLATGAPVRFQGTMAEYGMTPSFTITLDGTINEDDLAAGQKSKPKPKPKPRPRTRHAAHR